MPIAHKVTVYGCCWKCGGRRSQNVKLIEKHEQTCFANPARRACKTCDHDWPVGACALGLLPDGQMATVDCPGWEAR